MREIITAVILSLAIAVFGVHTGKAAEQLKNCGNLDPMFIDVGDIIDCGIVQIGDSRSFKFNASVGDKIRLTMTDMTSGSPAPYLGLIDPDNVLIHQWYVQDSGSHRDYDLTKTGEYTIVVWEYADDQAVDFRIALQGINPSPPEAVTLNHDSEFDGDIDPFADSDVFVFDGTSGDKIRLTMTDMTSGSPAPYLGLYDPDNVLIHQWYVQDSGSHRDYDLTKTGEYTIVVWEYADDQAVDFRIALQGINPSPPEAVTLNHDSEFDGDIDPFADSDVFVFDGTSGDKIRLTMTDMTSGSPAPYLGLYDPDNVLIHQWYVQDSGSHRDYDLTKTGEYTIVVWEYADDQAVDFRIALQGINPSPPGTLILCHNRQFEDDIDPFADSDVFVFDGTSGDKIRLTMTDMTSGSPAPYLGLYDPDNVLIHQWYVQDSGSHRDYDLTKTGEYTIVVWEYADDHEVTYKLSFNCISGDCFDECPLFADVPSGYWAEDYIYAIYDAGITTGCSSNPLKYCPQDDVTRAQMAAFIVRAEDGEPPANYCATGSPFTDVSPGYWACKYIKRLSELGITQGCGAGLYCPNVTVTRDQMAAFLVRSVDEVPPANYCATGSPFSDVSPGHWACKYIKRLSELGITQGCGAGLYCPNDPVTRAQMAVFLARAFLEME